VRLTVFAVEVLGLVAEWIGFCNEVALVIVTGFPDAAVGKAVSVIKVVW
jgi:UPF0716 family protein affecting phage T7 exclusion